MRTYRPRFFCFTGFRAAAAAGKSEPTLPNLLIIPGIIKRFEEKLKGILLGKVDYFLAAFLGIQLRRNNRQAYCRWGADPNAGCNLGKDYHSAHYPK